jgi:hypothetical protein
MTTDPENPLDMTKWKYADGTPVIPNGEISENELEDMYHRARQLWSQGAIDERCIIEKL